MNISDCVFELEKLRKLNQAIKAAAQNILFKRRQKATLTDADFEWLERAVGEKA